MLPLVGGLAAEPQARLRPSETLGEDSTMEFLPTFENTRSSQGLAAALGWSNIDLISAEIQNDHTRIDIKKGKIGGESAAIFGTVSRRNGKDPVSEAALYAYHASAPWGVLADNEGLTIFNSHWLAGSEWFRLPHVAWTDVEQASQVLNAFSPQGLLENQPAHIASKLRDPTNFLKPIDDALVDRLDKWRDQALRYARNTDRVDELLQTFYAQLFL